MRFKTAPRQFHTREPGYMIATKLKIDIRKIAVIVFEMSVDILLDLRRPLVFALALVWWR